MSAELHDTALPHGRSGLRIRTRKVGIRITRVARKPADLKLPARAAHAKPGGTDRSVTVIPYL